jgi:hypothetical protein
VANSARNLVLVNNYEDALTIGREALEMASEFGLGELQAHALNTIGMARVSMGDFGGLAELDESLRLILEHGSPFEIGRVYNNLGFALYTAGRVEARVRAHGSEPRQR